MRMRFLGFSLLALLLVSGTAVAGPGQVINEWIPIGPFETLGYCTEVVHVEDGWLHIQGKESVSKTGNFRLSLHLNFQDVMGQGVESYDWYEVGLSASLSMAGKLVNDNQQFRAVLTGTLTNVYTYEVTSVHVNVLCQVNANGELTAEVLNVELICPELAP